MKISKFLSWFDVKIIDGLVDTVGKISINLGAGIEKLQLRSFQAYLAYAIFVIGILMFILVWVFYWMMKV